MGRHGSGKRSRDTASFEDQYGEMRGQDRDEHSNFSSGRGGGGGGGRGGGTAGGSKRGGDVSYQRQVPKFLQPFAHMLGELIVASRLVYYNMSPSVLPASAYHFPQVVGGPCAGMQHHYLSKQSSVPM